MTGKFDRLFYRYDRKVFYWLQAVHVCKEGKFNKTCGGILGALSLLIDVIFSYEVWTLLLLCLSVLGQDALAEEINYFLILNILTVQGFKRFLLRRRPHARAQRECYTIFKLGKDSCIVSQTVVAATTLTYASLQPGLWMDPAG